MASWTVLEEQVVWISPRATSFTVVCDQCLRLGETASVQGRLDLDAWRGWLSCPKGHSFRIERDGR